MEATYNSSKQLYIGSENFGDYYLLNDDVFVSKMVRVIDSIILGVFDSVITVISYLIWKNPFYGIVLYDKRWQTDSGMK